MYLDLLTKYKEQHKFKLFSYYLLPDRLHLLIETGNDATISDIMHDLNSLYTKYFNGRYERKGHLFESRFKSVLVEKVNHLLQMTRFIHRAGDIEKHPYTSFHVYRDFPTVSSYPANNEQDVAEVMGFLKDRDQARAYERYCLEGDAQEIQEFEKSLSRASILGSAAFVQQVKNRLAEYSSEQKQDLMPQPGRSRALLFLIGAAVVAATGSSVYLYISKTALETKFEVMLEKKEAEFAERSRFENRSPLLVTELEGTVWEVELIPAFAGGRQELIPDKLHFHNGRFYSEFFESKGFRSSNYFLVPQARGAALWQSAQASPKGESVSWRGEWRGDAMKGTVRLILEGKGAQDFSFFSSGWAFIPVAAEVKP